jgi:hypothetical protein
VIIFAKNLLTLPPFTYTGSYILTEIIVNGTAYHLMKISTSGTFTALQERNVDIWLCGGGAAGLAGNMNDGGYGGAGGETNAASVTLEKLVDIQVTIGQGGIENYSQSNGGPSAFGALSAGGGNFFTGGSGGGAGGMPSDTQIKYGGGGQGTSTVPFGDVANFLPHCAGGGGGGISGGVLHQSGGAGGSNGSNGLPSTIRTSPYDTYGGNGGTPGGGNGGYTDSFQRKPDVYGGNASFWGCGGGGFAGTNAQDHVGRGYQGIIYLRWPI